MRKKANDISMMSTGEIREKFAEVANIVHSTGKHVIFTRNEKPVMAAISVEDLEILKKAKREEKKELTLAS